jgi:predicted kinase
VAGDESDQSVTKTAFKILHRRLARRLAEGAVVVVDATNVTPFARRALVRRAATAGVPAVALVLALERRLVQARNATREGRIVPGAAVSQQMADLERSLRRGLEPEGFAAVHLLHTAAELDELAVEWVRPPTPPR